MCVSTMAWVWFVIKACPMAHESGDWTLILCTQSNPATYLCGLKMSQIKSTATYYTCADKCCSTEERSKLPIGGHASCLKQVEINNWTKLPIGGHASCPSWNQQLNSHQPGACVCIKGLKLTEYLPWSILAYWHTCHNAWLDVWISLICLCHSK